MKNRVLSLAMALAMFVSLGAGPALQAAAATEPVTAPVQTQTPGETGAPELETEQVPAPAAEPAPEDGNTLPAGDPEPPADPDPEEAADPGEDDVPAVDEPDAGILDDDVDTADDDVDTTDDDVDTTDDDDDSDDPDAVVDTMDVGPGYYVLGLDELLGQTVGSAEDPETSALADGQENEPAPAANIPTLYSLNYAETGAAVLKPGTLAPIEDTNVLWLLLTNVADEAYKSYTYKLTGPEDIALGTAKFSGMNSKYVYWTDVTFQKGGKYTLTVSTKEGVQVGTKDIEIYRVTFDANKGAFSNQKDQYIGSGMKESRWALYNKPADPTRGDDTFIGWSTDPDASTYERLIYNAGSAVKEDPYNVTVYAAYGRKKVWALKLKKGAEELKPEDGTNNSYVVPHEFIFGDGTEAGTLTLTVENASDEAIPDIRLLSNISNYTLTYPDFPSGDEAFGEGASFQLILKPKNLGVDHYTDIINLNVSGNGVPISAGITITIETTVKPSTVVTVKPERTTKKYGETIDASTVKYTLANNGDKKTLADLGVNLESSGFAASAEVNETGYDYSLSGVNANNGTVVLDNTNKVTVEKATPEVVGVTATRVPVGSELKDSLLTGNASNPYTHEAVTGEFKWKDETTTLTESGVYDWTFTPTGNDAKNYTQVEGSSRVQVGENPRPVISLTSPSTTFTYNGRPQSLLFTAFVGEESVPYTTEYRSEDAWIPGFPTDAGTYTVRVTTPETDEYASAEYTVNMTIEKMTLSPTVNVSSKVYDGTTKAIFTGPYSVYPAPGDEVTVTATGEFTDKNAGNQVVAITYAIDENSEDAANYRLKSETVHYSALILTKQITIKVRDNAPIKKEYGDTLSFTGERFEAEGLAPGEELKDQHVDFVSKGAEAAADVGTYGITAKAHGGNYTTGAYNNAPGVAVDAGTMEVVPAKPTLSLNGVTAGEGTKGGSLRDVALNGTFVNPHVASLPAVKGNLEWVNPDATLPENASTYEAEWKFTPTDPNYTHDELNGTVNVTLLDKPVVQIEVADKSVPYTGEPQGIDLPADIDERVDVVVEYRLHQDIVTAAYMRQADALHDADFTTVEPTDAGTYDVHVHLYVKPEYQDELADNLIQPTLIITQALPNVGDVYVVDSKGGRVEGNAVLEGTLLQDVKLGGARRVTHDDNGSALEGHFAWEHAAEAVADAGYYTWTFTPDDPNYTAVTGSTLITLAPDTRKIEAEIYNLPQSLGYHDYAVVNVAGIGLKEGDVFAFFTNDGDDSPECEPIIVTAAMLDAEKLTVRLDDDALLAAGGTITARITSSQMHEGTVLSYIAEPDFTVAEKVVITLGETGALDITVAEGYPADHYTVSVTANEGDIVSVEHDGSSPLHAGIKAERLGSTTLQVSVTFTSDVGSVTITKTVNVTVSDHAGRVVVDMDTWDTDAPKTTVDGQELQNAVLTDEDMLLVEQGADVIISLAVTDASDAADEQKAVVSNFMAANLPGYTVGQYLNIYLFKRIETGDDPMADPIIPVTNTNRPLTLKFEVPASLQKAGRTFCVVRLHNGVATPLADEDGYPDTITISTDRFSLYTIVYKDPEPEGPEEPQPTPVPQPPVDAHPEIGANKDANGNWHTPAAAGAPAAGSVSAASPSAIPQTGDTAPLGLCALLFALSLAGLGALLLWRRKNNER